MRLFIVLSALILSCAGFSSSPPVQTVATQQKPVIMLYYATYCPYCEEVMDYLDSIKKTVPMKNIDNPDAKNELRKLGGRVAVPCLIVDGEAIYDSDRVIDWLSSHQQFLDPA